MYSTWETFLNLFYAELLSQCNETLTERVTKSSMQKKLVMLYVSMVEQRAVRNVPFVVWFFDC